MLRTAMHPSERPTAGYLARLCFGLVAYAAGGVVTPALLLFAGGLPVPWAIDRAPMLPPLPAAAADAGLLLLFALQHSWMARPGCKRWLARWVPPSLERSVYVLSASGCLLLLMAAWQPIPGVVWALEGSAADLMWALYALGLVLVYAATFDLGHFRLLGLWQAYMDGSAVEETPALRTGGLYRWVRHPLMSALLLVFFAAPTMSRGHLLFAVLSGLYVLIGTSFEERSLLRQYGEAYRRYRRRTPRLLPWRWPEGQVAGEVSPAPSAAVAGSEIHARAVEVDFSSEEYVLWYNNNFFGTALHNAYSVLFPPLERMMVRSMKELAPEVRDAALAADLRGFTAQEATHARQHELSSAVLARQGLRLAGLTRFFERFTDRLLEPLLSRLGVPLFGQGFRVAVFAGVEHWTATIARSLLGHEYTTPPGSPMAILYFWHGAEELEHKCVVADVMHHLRVGYLMRVLGFLCGNIFFVLLSLVGLAAVMAQMPRVALGAASGLSGWVRRLVMDSLRFLFLEERLLLHMARAFGEYLAPGFHPSRHDTRHLVAFALGKANLAEEARARITP